MPVPRLRLLQQSQARAEDVSVVVRILCGNLITFRGQSHALEKIDGRPFVYVLSIRPSESAWRRYSDGFVDKSGIVDR